MLMLLIEWQFSFGNLQVSTKHYTVGTESKQAVIEEFLLKYYFFE